MCFRKYDEGTGIVLVRGFAGGLVMIVAYCCGAGFGRGSVASICQGFLGWVVVGVLKGGVD